MIAALGAASAGAVQAAAGEPAWMAEIGPEPIAAVDGIMGAAAV